MHVKKTAWSGLAPAFSVAVLALAFAACGNGGTSSGDAHAGEMLVQQNACATCHQSSSAGAGVLAGGDMVVEGSQAYGPNLTPDKDTGIGSWTDAQIDKAVREGVDDEGETLCEIMPRFGTFSDQDVADLIAYLRSLPAVKHEVPDGDCE
jgi:mono/diheme cytochrome c family protein